MAACLRTGASKQRHRPISGALSRRLAVPSRADWLRSSGQSSQPTCAGLPARSRAKFRSCSLRLRHIWIGGPIQLQQFIRTYTDTQHGQDGEKRNVVAVFVRAFSSSFWEFRFLRGRQGARDIPLSVLVDSCPAVLAVNGALRRAKNRAPLTAPGRWSEPI